MPIGVDTGGTFTDVVVRASDGSLRTFKLLSTPDDPSSAIADGVAAIGAAQRRLVHGTTVATNALLERRGATAAFVTTAGFEDILAIGRQNRPELYALEPVLPAPLIPRTRCIGVDERIAFDGAIRRPMSAGEVARVVAAVSDLEVEAVAICLLHAYANAEHERRIAEALRKAYPTLHVSVSSELAPEFREYERASTVAVNAYVGPIMAHYLGALQRKLPRYEIEILQSSGGRAAIEEVGRAPAHTLLSGPAGGVVGALAAADELGFGRIITFDMGGTSTDVSMCAGAPHLRHDAEVDGFPVRLPTLDIVTVGAGGGSIARRDQGGALRVGPASAGAVPGPACYGRGGTAPTVTDAHLVLGRLRADRFLGGAMQLDEEASAAAIARLAAELGVTSEECARGILDVADAAMVRAIKVVSIQRGHDPRDCALVSFGGAGGLHACRLAEALQMKTVVIPRHPGLLSAYGMLHAPRVRFYSRSMLHPLETLDIEGTLAELVARAEADLGREVETSLSFDLRYSGQSFEVATMGGSLAQLAERFHASHDALFGYRDDAREIEVVAARLSATVVETGWQRGVETQPTSDAIALDGGVVEREALGPGARAEGPVVVTEYSGTTVVEKGWTLEVVGSHLVLRRDG